MAVPYPIVPNQTTALVNEMFPTTGILGTSLYESDPEPRVRPGTDISAVTGNGKAVYAKTHAALAANAACTIAMGTGAEAGIVKTAAGTGYKAIVAHSAAGKFGWFISDTAAV